MRPTQFDTDRRALQNPRGARLLRSFRHLAAGLAWLLTLAPGQAADADLLWLLPPQSPDLALWQARDFEGRTTYTTARVEGLAGIRAQTRGGATGLAQEVPDSFADATHLSWCWRADAPIEVVDPRRKEGDDFAARVYVIFGSSPFPFLHTTLVYVWGNAAAPAGWWENPFTDQARMLDLAPESDAMSQGLPYHHRNLERDYREAFRAAPPPIRAVAIMTDGDQTAATASAFYGAIALSHSEPSAPSPCTAEGSSR